MKYIKKITPNPAKAAAKATSKDAVKHQDAAAKSATKVYGMPCLPQHSD